MVVKKENYSEDKFTKLEDENLKLKEMLCGYEQVFTENKALIEALQKDLEHRGRFEDLYSDVKDKLAEAEKQIANFRSDLLKVKAEK